MDYNKRHFERFNCRICTLTITELLHLTFTRKTSSFSARLSAHAAKPNTTFHSNYMHTMCSHMRSHGNAQECDKSAGFIVMKTKLPCPTCARIISRYPHCHLRMSAETISRSRVELAISIMRTCRMLITQTLWLPCLLSYNMPCDPLYKYVQRSSTQMTAVMNQQ